MRFKILLSLRYPMVDPSHIHQGDKAGSAYVDNVLLKCGPWSKWGLNLALTRLTRRDSVAKWYE